VRSSRLTAETKYAPGGPTATRRSNTTTAIAQSPVGDVGMYSTVREYPDPAFANSVSSIFVIARTRPASPSAEGQLRASQALADRRLRVGSGDDAAEVPGVRL
jgi:hypothetical protein